MEEESDSLAKSDSKASKKEKKKTDKAASGISEDMRPEFKEAMDSYEAFYDEYCKILKQYNENPTDISLLTKYSEMIAKLSDVDEKFKAWNEDEMNQAELNYYLEVQGRVTKKILKVTQ